MQLPLSITLYTSPRSSSVWSLRALKLNEYQVIFRSQRLELVIVHEVLTAEW